MRLLAFLISLGITYYAAAMYQSLPLLFLCILEGMFAFVLFGLTVYFHKKVTLKSLEKRGVTEKGSVYWYEGNIQNKGMLPVGKIQIRMSFGYNQESIGIEKVFYGGSDKGTGTFRFGIEVPYCGLVWMNLDRLKVYDYVSLFSFPKSIKQNLLLAVFPKEKPLHITLSVWHKADDSMQFIQDRWSAIREPSETYGEIQQIREYREGESIKHIHWNQTARTGQLWVREYEPESGIQTELFLDLESPTNQKLIGRLSRWLDAFYELASALMLGLLQASGSLRVSWYNSRQGCLVSQEVMEKEACQMVLLQIYQEKPLESEMKQKRISPGEKGFRLNLDLEWYEGENLLYQFSRETLEEEIMGRWFEI